MVKALGIGDNVCDLYLHAGMMYPGGQALNFAVNSRFLDSEAAFIGVMGTDAIALYNQSVMDTLHVDRSHCRIINGDNGFAKVVVKNGERVFVGSNRGGILQQAPIILDSSDIAYIEQFDVVHISNNGFLDDQLVKLKGLHSLVSYDFSTSWVEPDKLSQISPWIDVAFLSCGQCEVGNVEYICKEIHQKGNCLVIATQGSAGVTAFDGCDFYRYASRYVEPVDTMGAGDGFAAAVMNTIGQFLVANRLSKRQLVPAYSSILPKALTIASDYAAKCCLVSGAFGYGTVIPESVAQKALSETGDDSTAKF